MEAAVEPEAHQHHILAVLVSGHITVLDKLTHFLHLGVMVVLFQNSGQRSRSVCESCMENSLSFCSETPDSAPQLNRVGAAEVLSGRRIFAGQAQVHQILLAVAQRLQLGQLGLGRSLVRVPLDEEEILRLHAVIQPLAVGPEQVVQMVYLSPSVRPRPSSA